MPEAADRIKRDLREVGQLALTVDVWVESSTHLGVGDYSGRTPRKNKFSTAAFFQTRRLSNNFFLAIHTRTDLATV
ncbi:MAG TPA: hypothetical protein ENK57_16290 [Polyangiaceae bacterium]|nr:hypothetical protein [Polyangiaceae bacterium]